MTKLISTLAIVVVGLVVLLNALASVLPRITPSLAVLGVLVLIGRGGVVLHPLRQEKY
jgi:hypothetical protein